MSSLYIADVPLAEGKVGSPEVDASLGTELTRQLLALGADWINGANARGRL
jgi:hypothetical protein